MITLRTDRRSAAEAKELVEKLLSSPPWRKANARIGLTQTSFRDDETLYVFQVLGDAELPVRTGWNSPVWIHVSRSNRKEMPFVRRGEQRQHLDPVTGHPIENYETENLKE